MSFLGESLEIPKFHAKQKNLYFDFKEYCEDNNLNSYNVISDLHKYSELYNYIIDSSLSSSNHHGFSPKVTRKLGELRTLDSPTGICFYLAFLEYAKNNNVPTDVIVSVFDIIESWWGRKLICDERLDSFKNIFYTLHHDVLNTLSHVNHNANVNYAEVLKYLLLERQGRGAFPTDADIDREFPLRDVYKMQPSHRMFLLERMENAHSTQYRDIPFEMTRDTDKISIEHIMPQELTTRWRSDLAVNGGSPQQIYDNYLHKFANLTLTGYNSNYSNNPFCDKLHCIIDGIDQGLAVNNYRLNDYVKTCTKWTDSELKNRELILLGHFKTVVFPMITSVISIGTNVTFTGTLEDNDLEKFTPCSFKFNGSSPIQANDWEDVLVKICQHCLSQPTYQSTISTLFNSGQNSDFADRNGANKICINEELGYYVFSNEKNWTTRKEKMINKILECIGLSKDDLIFEMKK